MTAPLKKPAMTHDLHSPWRNDFPIFKQMMNGKPLTFLDSGASAQKPQVVIDAMRDVMEQGYANIHRGLYRLSTDLTARFEDVRAQVVSFINAPKPECIVFTRNTTEAINLVAQSWGHANIQSGDEIVITEMEHHANIVPWQILAQNTGAQIKIWPIDKNGHLQLGQLASLLSPRTKLVAFTHISNVLGTINPVAKITAQIKAYNPKITVLIDGSQGVVHGAVDVAAMNCDFYAFTGHKLYGPTGIGVLYGKYDVLQAMPPWQGGGDMIETVAFTGTTYRDAPYRFEAGTPPIVEVIGLGAAITYINSIGFDKIMAHEQALSAQLHQALSAAPGLTVYGPPNDTERAGIFAFSADFAHASDIAMVLDQCGVAVRSGHHCAMPLMNVLGGNATVRASIGLYNDASDIAALVAALNKARELLA